MGKLVRAGKFIQNNVLKREGPQKPRGLFLHIQKTAGSSIVKLAKDHYGESLISHGDFVGHRPEEFKNIAFVSGHFGYKYAKSLMESRYFFTFLRDPAERILSFYYYNRTRDIDEFPMTRIAHELDLEQFLKAGLVDPFVKSRIWNNQTWQLAHGFEHGTDRYASTFEEQELLDLAISHIEKFSHVGFTETFEYDKEIIFSALGLHESKKEVCVNKTGIRLMATDLSPVESMLLEELTALDRLLYQYAWSHRIL